MRNFTPEYVALARAKGVTPAQLDVLQHALWRPDGDVHPTHLRGACKAAVLRVLEARGYVTKVGCGHFISDAGADLVAMEVAP